MGDAWLDLLAAFACLLLATAVAAVPPSPRVRRLRSGTRALVRLRRPR